MCFAIIIEVFHTSISQRNANADELRIRVEQLLDSRRLMREKFALMKPTHLDGEKEIRLPASCKQHVRTT